MPLSKIFREINFTKFFREIDFTEKYQNLKKDILNFLYN